MPTRYIEPFGCVAAEALLCGTPVISSDTGGATEIVQHGYNGWRCRSLADYMQAVDYAEMGTIDYEDIAIDARARYSMQQVGGQYDAYFTKLANGGGWYAL